MTWLPEIFTQKSSLSRDKNMRHGDEDITLNC